MEIIHPRALINSGMPVYRGHVPACLLVLHCLVNDPNRTDHNVMLVSMGQRIGTKHQLVFQLKTRDTFVLSLDGSLGSD
jgi:hypothetical protein